MLSVCLNCVLFTLKGREVKDNKYIQIFTLWLSQLIRDGGMRSTDALYLYIDTETMKYLDSDFAFSNLIRILPCNLKIFRFEQPATLLEGMMLKYVYNEYEQDVYMYCDIDILFVKQMNLLLETLKINTLCLHIEGNIHEKMYGEAFTPKELENLEQNNPGFSAGKFILYGKELHKEFFSQIIALKSSIQTPDFYTLDQPIFNKVIYVIDLNKIHLDVVTLCEISISTNNNIFTSKTILLDLMGIPGDGEFHFNKVLSSYIVLRSGIPMYNI
jgi:hypothetical protein